MRSSKGTRDFTDLSAVAWFGQSQLRRLREGSKTGLKKGFGSQITNHCEGRENCTVYRVLLGSRDLRELARVAAAELAIVRLPEQNGLEEKRIEELSHGPPAYLELQKLGILRSLRLGSNALPYR